MHIADVMSISFGSKPSMVKHNIDVMKGLEKDRVTVSLKKTTRRLTSLLIWNFIYW